MAFLAEIAWREKIPGFRETYPEAFPKSDSGFDQYGMQRCHYPSTPCPHCGNWQLPLFNQAIIQDAYRNPSSRKGTLNKRLADLHLAFPISWDTYLVETAFAFRHRPCLVGCPSYHTR